MDFLVAFSVPSKVLHGPGSLPLPPPPLLSLILARPRPHGILSKASLGLSDWLAPFLSCTFPQFLQSVFLTIPYLCGSSGVFPDMTALPPTQEHFSERSPL